MKRVKFNCSCAIHMIPDSKVEDVKNSMDNQRYEKLDVWRNRMLGSEFPVVNCKSGDVREVPNWWYEAHKDDIVTQSVSNERFTDKFGRPEMYDLNQAVKLGLNSSLDTMKRVKRFELVEDLDTPVLPKVKVKQATQMQESI